MNKNERTKNEIKMFQQILVTLTRLIFLSLATNPLGTVALGN